MGACKLVMPVRGSGNAFFLDSFAAEAAPTRPRVVRMKSGKQGDFPGFHPGYGALLR